MNDGCNLRVFFQSFDRKKWGKENYPCKKNEHFLMIIWIIFYTSDNLLLHSERNVERKIYSK